MALHFFLAACAPTTQAIIPTFTPDASPPVEKIAIALPTETRPSMRASSTPNVARGAAKPATATRSNTSATTPARIPSTRGNAAQASTASPTRTTAPASSQNASHAPTSLPPTATRTNTPTPKTATPIPASPTQISPPIPSNETYGTLAVFSAPTNPPAALHPDLNLALRGYAPTNATLALIDYTGEVGSGAPQLSGLFSVPRVPNFKSAYQTRDWDWTNQRVGGLLSNWDVTILSMGTTPGESIRVPDSGADIGNDYRALVLYADATRLTLKYTREDNVVAGYALHLENILVEENLLALYQQKNAAGRGELPALRARQVIGKAGGDQILVGVRDAGSFLDPRSRKDWWRGR
ncbi:MAG: hypothetical protein HY327_12535 [Chloroflexi bacterium]|nr:hypothetical protein [Chloroflexota bacterium]